jgi:hypothetical protein
MSEPVETPLRRSTDTHSEANAQRRHDILLHRVDRAGRALYEYLVITACIACLLTTFQTWQVLKRIDHAMVISNDAIKEQTHVLERIHKALTDERRK